MRAAACQLQTSLVAGRPSSSGSSRQVHNGSYCGILGTRRLRFSLCCDHHEATMVTWYPRRCDVGRPVGAPVLSAPPGTVDARISVWRNLRRLGALQLGHGLVGLPLDARSREQLEWLAGCDPGGGWRLLSLAGRDDVGRPGAGAHRAHGSGGGRGVPRRDHRRTTGPPGRAGPTAPYLGSPPSELRRIRSRDYFPPVEAEEAERAVQALAQELETAPTGSPRVRY